ncbi:hypothetical protein BHE74_00021863 [Ensete ventricosum]|nr:hypothetical protein BHE74_00021863 [Ensete ventricosum]RZR92255.1 hypothetical protein BHM03_00020496 [Ensete ventricosum]
MFCVCCLGRTSHNSMLQGESKLDHKSTFKNPFSKRSTLMRPTASQLAKQNRAHEVKSVSRYAFILIFYILCTRTVSGTRPVSVPWLDQYMSGSFRRSNAVYQNMLWYKDEGRRKRREGGGGEEKKSTDSTRISPERLVCAGYYGNGVKQQIDLFHKVPGKVVMDSVLVVCRFSRPHLCLFLKRALLDCPNLK